MIAQLGPCFPFVKDVVVFCCSARGTLGWQFSIVKLRSLT